MSPSPHTPVVLLVEDNPADAAFFREALLESGHSAGRLHVAAHGREALAFLRHEGRFAGAPRPGIIVLDLNLPVMSGRQMLAALMDDPELKDIPVAVLTTSTSERAVCGLCPPGHCLYFTKTDSLDQLREIIDGILAHATS